MQKRMNVLTAIIASSVLALAACGTGEPEETNTSESSSSSPAETVTPPEQNETIPLTITEIENAPEYELNEQGYALLVEDGKLVYHTAGSSSCPSTIFEGYYSENENLATLKAKDWSNPGQICTMDYNFYEQHLSLPDDAELPADVEVEIVLVSADGEEKDGQPCIISPSVTTGYAAKQN